MERVPGPRGPAAHRLASPSAMVKGTGSGLSPPSSVPALPQPQEAQLCDFRPVTRPPKPLLPLLENERNNQKASLRGFLKGVDEVRHATRLAESGTQELPNKD